MSNHFWLSLKQLRFYFLLLFMLCSCAQAQFIVSHREPAGGKDKRDEYTIALIHLALEKTKPLYGPYEMRSIPASFYNLRARIATTNNQFPNILLEESYDQEFVDQGKLDFINFPIDLGILGYRVCFVNPKVANEVTKVKTLEGLKKYTIGQGIGWQDAKILKHNGFKVVEVEAYESLFRMVAAGRIDFFCTGANQVMNEYLAHKDIPALMVDRSFALQYPLPRFFFVNHENQQLKKRISEGLQLAFKDGSLRKLWEEKHLPSIEFIQLPERKIFKLESPLLGNLDRSYQKFNYAPPGANK